MDGNKICERKNLSFILNLLSLNSSTLRHPSRNVKKLVRMTSVEPGEEIWATDMDLRAILI